MEKKLDSIHDVIALLIKLGKISKSLGNSQQRLLINGFKGIIPEIRKHYTIDDKNECYIIN
jgi:hypothetical protein